MRLGRRRPHALRLVRAQRVIAHHGVHLAPLLLLGLRLLLRLKARHSVLHVVHAAGLRALQGRRLLLLGEASLHGRALLLLHEVRCEGLTRLRL